MNYNEWKNAHAFRIPQKALEDLDALINSLPDQMAAAVLREREECAMVCENMWGDDGDANDFAQAIRNRGTK